MQKITVQSETAKSLTNLNQKVLVCDDTGKELGFFQPASKTTIECQLSIAETEELRKRNQTGKPLEEILKKWDL